MRPRTCAFSVDVPAQLARSRFVYEWNMLKFLWYLRGLHARAGGRSLLVCTRGGAALCACSYAKVCVRVQGCARNPCEHLRCQFMGCQFPPGPHRWAFTPSAGCATHRHLTHSDHTSQTNTLCWGFDQNSFHLPHVGAPTSSHKAVRRLLVHVSKGHSGQWLYLK